ncbi:MAG: hypothetical protein M3347_04220 [Armatimonadota bacterium]|nr:hypothetical protein [Armatimonadota bacterium]
MDLATKDVSFQDCLEAAETCCEQARLAARCRRFKAACGLFSTATTLYRHAMSLDGITYPALEKRLQEIETEMSAYCELAKSMARPLLKSITPSQMQSGQMPEACNLRNEIKPESVESHRFNNTAPTSLIGNRP